MQTEKYVERIEVKKNLLKALLFTPKPDAKKYELKQNYRLVMRVIENMGESEIDYSIGNDLRKKRYNDLDWKYKEKVKLGDMGTWPNMQFLDWNQEALDLENPSNRSNINLTDKLFTLGSITETAERISEFNKEKLPPDLISRLNAIRMNIQFIMPNFPLILVPGGVIRSDNSQTGNNGSSNDVYFRPTRFDLEDGNTRGVAYALNGITHAPAYIGYKKE
jgi:hypothetical protein